MSETPTRSALTALSTWTLLATFKAQRETVFGGQFPNLAPARDLVLALETAQFWAEAGALDPARKEAGIDLIQDGFRGHPAWGLGKDPQNGFLDGGRSAAALNSRLRDQSCLSLGVEADRLRRLIKLRGLTIKLVQLSKHRMKLILQLTAQLGQPFVLGADFASPLLEILTQACHGPALFRPLWLCRPGRHA